MPCFDLRVAFGSDHRAYAVRQHVLGLLRWIGCEVEDLGSDSPQPVDYPQIAAAVARRISTGQSDQGVLLGATGLEMALVANKFPGVRAVAVPDELLAETSRRHFDANVLCLSADLMSEAVIEQIIVLWLNTPFDAGRHSRRLEQITSLEHEIHSSETLAHPLHAG